MKHLEDKQLCPHCGEAVHRQPYVMSRRAAQAVLDPKTVYLIVLFALVATVLTLGH